MIKKNLNSFPVLILSILCLALVVKCENAAENTNTQEDNYIIPESSIVFYTELPQTFSDRDYFYYAGWPAGQEPTELQLEFSNYKAAPVLTLLLENGFKVEKAWNATGEWGCELAAPTYSQMIVRLTIADDRIKQFGFTSDSSRLQIFGIFAGCVPDWEYYQFK